MGASAGNPRAAARRAWTAAEARRLADLRRAGRTWADCAADLGRPEHSVRGYVRRHGLAAPAVCYKAAVAALARRGLSDAEVARALGCSEETARRWRARLVVRLRPWGRRRGGAA